MISESDINDRLMRFEASYKYNEIEKINAEIDGFNKAFPETEIDSLTKERYVLGTKTNKESNFCWWVEYGTKEVATIGGYASKHKLYYNKDNSTYVFPLKYSNEDECLIDIKANLKKLYNLVKEDDLAQYNKIDLPHNISIKIAYLLNHTKFIPILDKKHLNRLCEIFGIEREGLNSLQENRKILEYFKANRIAKEWHTVKIMQFCYSEYGFNLKGQVLPQQRGVGYNGWGDIEGLLHNSKQIILYGPPGTGKTYITRLLSVDILMKG